MKISSSNDYSTLFSSLNTNDSIGFSLTDYTSIKNGSYGKLLKAYYGSNSTTTSGSKNLSDTQTKNLSSTKTAAEELKSATKKLSDELKAGDAENVYKAVADLSDKYNKLVEAAGSSDNSTIKGTAQRMMDDVASNLSLLSNAGITFDGTTGKMNVDETKVKENVSKLNTLFNGAGSLGDSISARASSIANKASSVLNTSKTYNANASYNNSSYVGELYDSYN